MSDSTILPRVMYIEEFLPLKGRTFLADCDPKAASLELADVLPGRQIPGSERQGFILIFRSNPDTLLLKGMYKMKCGSFGPEIIYIEQTNAPPDPGAPAGYYYQAVFN